MVNHLQKKMKLNQTQPYLPHSISYLNPDAEIGKV